MTTIEETVSASSSSRGSSWFAGFESLLERIGEHLNPILIKEARQALKSRQFTITFILVLVAGWGWSIVGLAWMGPGIYWGSDGPSMFYGYVLILAFPLTVIVPYGAFRSLAAEREDRTYELLSITSLRPTQIIGGKLAGAVLQMLVYLSAVSPCLAFTYLLRGLDILTIGSILAYLFFGSLGLSLICLMLATVTNEKYQQVVLSVGIIFALAYGFIMVCVLTAAWLSEGAGVDLQDFLIVTGACATAFWSYFALFFLAASAQLAFAGSNRSTPLRIVILIQQALFLAWMIGIWWVADDLDVLTVAVLMLGIHWYVTGIFMTGEPRQLSPRVMRALPQSFLGRAFLTWFNPGPASGYMFVLSSFVGALIVILALVFASHNRSGPTSGIYYVGLMSWLCLSYLTIFLGIGRAILAVVARYVKVTVAVRILIHVALLFSCTLIPLTIQLTIPELRHEGYIVLQASNPFWTLAEATEYVPPAEIWPVALLLGSLAVIVYALNLSAAAEEVRQVRIAAPQRVAEDDVALAAALAPVVPVKNNPWD